MLIILYLFTYSIDIYLVEDDRLSEIEFNLTNHNLLSDKTTEKIESQNVKINGHKNKKKSSSPENRFVHFCFNM